MYKAKNHFIKDSNGNPVTQSVVGVTDSSGNPVTGRILIQHVSNCFFFSNFFTNQEYHFL